MKSMKFLAAIIPILLAHTVVSEDKCLLNYDKEVEWEEDTDNSRDKPVTTPDAKKAGKAFREILIRTLLLSGQPFLGHPLGIFTAAVDLISGGSKQSVWEQVAGKVKDSIHQEQTKKHFNDLNDEWRYYRTQMSLGGDKFDVNGFIRVLSDKTKFFPQDHKNLVFTKNWILAIESYLIFFTGSFLEMTHRNHFQDKCEFAKQLGVVRDEIVMAAKALHKKHYKMVDGIRFNHGQVYYKPGATKPICGWGNPKEDTCNTNRRLRYKDKATGWDSGYVYCPDVPHFVLNKIQKNTTDMIMKLVDKFNQCYLNQDLVGEGCTVPERIKRGDVVVPYLKSCYEKPNKRPRNKKCKLPCHKYYKNYNWCPTNLKKRTWYGKWEYCEPADFELCIPTNKTSHHIPKWSK